MRAASLLIVIALAGVRGDCPSDWYYKSGQSCTGSDSPNTMKCKPGAESWSCSREGEATCNEADKASCADIGKDVSPSRPNGLGFMCPSLMLGTSELRAAAEADGYHGTYGVVTIDALSCGQCVEIANEDSTHFPHAPTILAQVFNSVASSVDLFMVGGGLGANNGCAAIPNQYHQPVQAMYSKYPSSDNTDLIGLLKKQGYASAGSQIDQAILYNGGLRGGRTFSECVSSGKSHSECQPPGNGCDGGGGICFTDPDEICPVAYQGRSSFVTQKAQESCKYVFDHDLHWNRPISYKVVTCPASLTALTGLVPSASLTNSSAALHLGNSVQTTSTTMEDCCEPTCSRSSKVSGSWEQGFEAMYTCNLAGEPYLEETNDLPDPCDSSRRRSGRRRCSGASRRAVVV